MKCNQSQGKLVQQSLTLICIRQSYELQCIHQTDEYIRDADGISTNLFVTHDECIRQIDKCIRDHHELQIFRRQTSD